MVELALSERQPAWPRVVEKLASITELKDGMAE